MCAGVEGEVAGVEGEVTGRCRIRKTSNPVLACNEVRVGVETMIRLSLRFKTGA